MFAILVQEREPFKLEDLPFGFYSWVVAVGGFCGVGLVIWVLSILLSPDRNQRVGQALSVGRLTVTAVLAVAIALICLGWISLHDPAAVAAKAQDASQPGFLTGNPRENTFFQDASPYSLASLVVLALASFCLAAVLVPFLHGLTLLSWRRIWALARLSYKEAVRRRILWVFSILLVAFLFAGWFLPYKPEDQVRTYVDFVYLAMTILLLFTAALLASFSLPADMRSQNIHTIVTKPVERFEIILGRVLGYTLLMSVVLVVMTLLSVVYVARGVELEAAEESLKARVPVFADLEVYTVKQGKRVKEGKSVGREWEYRAYISGGTSEEQAIFNFNQVPANLADRETVRVEFGFDIFRTSKGDEENKGIYCSFIFDNWKWNPNRLNEYREAKARAQASPDPQIARRAQEEHWSDEKTSAMLLGKVAEEFGRFELNSKEVTDYHTQFVEIPGTLFKDLPEWEQLKADKSGSKPPALRLTVWCESVTQLLGVAKYDLYLLDAERSPFVNFFKGAIGLWFRLFVVIGLAVTCSTYLSGVISFLTVAFLYLTGLSLEFIKRLAENKSVGGGPMEALLRVGRGENMIMPLDQTPPTVAALWLDEKFRFVLRLVLNVFPDVNRYDLTEFVAEGFNISFAQLLTTGLLALGYVLPWLVLGYYLMKSREVAASM